MRPATIPVLYIAATGTTPHTATLVTVIPSVPSVFTGTIAGIQHYSTGTMEGPLLYYLSYENVNHS